MQFIKNNWLMSTLIIIVMILILKNGNSQPKSGLDWKGIGAGMYEYTIDGCQYLVYSEGGVAHKENCNNKIHLKEIGKND